MPRRGAHSQAKRPGDHNRERRQQTAAETLKIMTDGWYLRGDEQVSIHDMMERALRGSTFYDEGECPMVQLQKAGPCVRPTIVRGTTLEIAAGILAGHPDAKVAALNFASARNPGGGVLKGANAQEENNCIASGLFACLNQFRPEFYDAHSRNPCDGLYSHRMIYSPDVPVFRDEKLELLQTPYCVSFITSPAVNYGLLKTKISNPMASQLTDREMKERILKVLTIAASQHVSHLILGCWGTGVFKNSPKDIASYFYTHLSTTKWPFEVVFAIPVFSHADEEKVAVFATQFS